MGRQRQNGLSWEQRMGKEREQEPSERKGASWGVGEGLKRAAMLKQEGGSGHSVHHSGDPALKRVPGAHQVVISWQLEGSQVEVGGADNDRSVDSLLFSLFN